MTQRRSKAKGSMDKDPMLDLSVGQVLAASGATTLGALLVKLLDIWGTILGMAVLSVCTSIGAVLILRAVRRTGERLKAQMEALSPAARSDATTVELDPAAAEALEDEAPDVAPTGEAHSRKRTVVAILVSSVLVFAVTLGALALLGKLATGDTTRLIVDDRTTTVYITPEADEAPTAPEPTAPDPTENESPSTETDEPPTDEETEEAPTEDPSTEAPSEDAGDDGEGGSEQSPTPPTSN